MRTFLVSTAICTALALAAPAVAQMGTATTSGGGTTTSAGNLTTSAGSTTTSNGAITSGAMRSRDGTGATGPADDATQMGTPPSALGSGTTLSQNIDRAAGLNSRRAIINGTAGSLPPETARTTGNTLPGSNALERAGRPNGAPLGGGTVSPAPAAGVPAAVPDGAAATDPRRSPL